MARTKKSEIKAQEIAEVQTSTTEIAEVTTEEVQTSATKVEEVQVEEVKVEEVQTSTVKLERANRIAVQTIGAGYKADFYRTHKKLTTLLSDETGWEADESMNKSAQREDFRKYVIDHAEIYGILWNPNDMRAEENRRFAKYENDEDLKTDAVNMLGADIEELVAKCPYDVTHLSTEAEAIVPVTHTAKGVDLSKLGIIDGKYERSGNWAWADVEIAVTLFKETETIYFTTKCQLVSGQLKKPHLTQTAFNESMKESLKEVGLWEEEVKEETAK